MVLFIVSVGAYVFLVYFMLPPLLYGGRFDSILQHPGYFFFAGLTAGLGPIIWYYWSVDPALRRMAGRERNE